MERRKTKISLMCISALVVVALVFSVVGVALFGKSSKNESFLSNNNINTTADISSEDYLGRIGNQEAYKKNLADNSNQWAPIDNAEDLRKFLKGESNGSGKEYNSKQGFLTRDITDFNWTDAYAPNIDFGSTTSRILDGCGYTITYNAYNEIAGVIRTGQSNSIGMSMYTQQTGKAYPFSYDGSDAMYSVFSLFVTRLGQYGTLQNFRFNIKGGVFIEHQNEGKKNKTISVLGGLVGYVAGGKIDNVCVALGKDDGSESKLFLKRDHSAKKYENIACVGGGVGFCENGRITNFSFILKQGGLVKSESYTKYWNTADQNNGLAITGGLIGYAFFGGTLKNLAFYGQGGILETFVEHDKVNFGGESSQFAWEVIGGIMAFIGNESNVSSAAVGGNLNCMKTSNKTSHIDFRRKNAFIASTRPAQSSGKGDPADSYIDSKVYFDVVKNSSGSYTGSEPCAWNSDGSREESFEGRSECSDTTKGYKVSGGPTAYITTQDGVKAYLDNKDNTYSSIAVFVPEGKVLWEAFGRKRYSELLSGALCGWNSDANSKGLSLNEAIENGMSIINAGISGEGEVGFYKRLDSGTGLSADDQIYEDSKGYKWQEMSDQSRAFRNGGKDSPLYYDGTQYELKMLVGGILYDEGLLVENLGNLKDSMNTHNGRPVKLSCNDGGDPDTALSYIMETDQEKVVISLSKTTGMDRLLSIQKRQMFVHKSGNYVRGTSNIFDGVKLRFGRMPKDPSQPNSGEYVANTGLVSNEVILWQETRIAQGQEIELDVAGHQMLRPSTNNYIIYEWVSTNSSSGYLREVGGYFSAIIAPQTITLGTAKYGNNDGKHIYINGEAYDGKYEIINGHTYDDEEKNNQKRKITISARDDDAHFTARGIVLYNEAGGIVREYRFEDLNKDDRGLYNIEYLVTDSSVARIGLLDYNERTYIINPGSSGMVNGEYGSKAFKYGETVTLSIPTLSSSQAFDGWKINGTENYYSFRQTITFKVTQSLDITPVTVLTEENPWTIKYYTDYKDTAVFKDGEELRIRRLNDVYDEAWHFENYKLQDRMGRRHTGWKMVAVDEIAKTASFVAVYDDGEGNNPAKVQVIWNNQPTYDDYVFFGSPITLQAKKTYYVNDVEVVVGDTPLTIFAITNLYIDEKRLVEVQSNSMDYSSFLRVENGVPTYYISITFVYGKFDQSYIDTEEARLDKPQISMPGFTEADFTQYVRQGNIYQISMVITERELECRFGHNSEITTFLTIIEPATNTKPEKQFTFDKIMIFKRKTVN